MPLDAQSRAFRESTSADRVPDDQLADHTEAVHAPLADLSHIRLPEDYEAEEWDAGRVGPKSVAEARHALAARIADPSAPDGPEVAGAYDELG